MKDVFARVKHINLKKSFALGVVGLLMLTSFTGCGEIRRSDGTCTLNC